MSTPWNAAAPVPGIYPGLGMADYQAAAALSRSRLKVLLSGTPHDFRANNAVEETAAMRLGTALHLAVLEPESFLMHVVSKPRFKGKGSVAKRREWEAAHADRIIVPEPDYARAKEAATLVRKKKGPATALREGEAEMSAFWRQGEHLCKFRADFCSLDRGFVCDIKVTKRGLSDRQAERILVEQYAAMQLAMMYAGVFSLTSERITPYLLMVNVATPLDMRLVHVDEPWLLYGEAQFLEALRIYAECEASGDWWSEADRGVTTVPLPQRIQKITEALNAKALQNTSGDAA